MDWHAGKVALVTGGGRGIGRGIVLCLARDGADVAVVDLVKATAEAVGGEVEAAGRRALALAADLTRREEVEAAVAAVLAHFGQIDILVNNAGAGGAPGWPERQHPTEADWDVAWAVNVRSHVLVAEAVAPHMIA